MVNFAKLKALISDMERRSGKQQSDFFMKLRDLADLEMRIRQTNLTELFK